MKTINKPTPTALFKAALDSVKRRAIIAQHKRVLYAAFVRLPQVKPIFVTLAKAALGGEHPWVNTSEYSAEVSLGLTLRELESFKDERLTKLVSAFAGDEWTATTTDYTYDPPNRDYRFTMEIEAPLADLLDEQRRGLRLTAAEQRSLAWLREQAPYEVPRTVLLTVGIYAYVKADSAACRIEVVGIEEEVIKKEIKRIVCA
jgi:hypothetical protein